MKIKYKIWLEYENKAFGKGPYDLLIKIDKLGSINMACKEMSMSYSKGFKIIKNIENELGFKLLDRKVGGKEGGGCNLTKYAYKLINTYENLIEELDSEINKLFKKHFDNII